MICSHEDKHAEIISMRVKKIDIFFIIPFLSRFSPPTFTYTLYNILFTLSTMKVSIYDDTDLDVNSNEYLRILTSEKMFGKIILEKFSF